MKTILFSILLTFLSFTSFSQSPNAEPKEGHTEEIYDTVSKVPVFTKQGGNVQKYLSKNLQYPVDALAKEVEGKVFVSFVITSDGELKNLMVEKSLSPSTDAEALRVVASMKKWKPAQLNGKEVATKVTLPVHFYLSPENKDLAQQIKPFYINNKPPLFVIDKRKVLGVTTLEYYNIKSIRVVKGERAVQLYGKDATNGVLIIETKRGTPRRN